MGDSLIKLSSGRVLGFAEFGDPGGTPLFYFHGWPSSRLQGELMDEAGKKFGLRIIAPDRPGIATSEFHPGRTLLDWPPLIRELAAHLGLGKFYVWGMSGGGPYALVCAHAMPDLLLGVGVVCGAPPLREVGTEGLFWAYQAAMWAQRRLPFTVGPGLKVASWVAGRSYNQWPRTWLAKPGSTEDTRARENPRLLRILKASGGAAVASPAKAIRWDGNLYSSDWGFKLADITLPVHFWHGEKDGNIPYTLAQKAASWIPHSTFKTYPHDGHYSLPLLRTEEMVAELLESCGHQKGK